MSKPRDDPGHREAEFLLLELFENLLELRVSLDDYKVDEAVEDLDGFGEGVDEAVA